MTTMRNTDAAPGRKLSEASPTATVDVTTARGEAADLSSPVTSTVRLTGLPVRILNYLVQPRWWVEIVVIYGIYLVYSLIRNGVHDVEAAAFANGARILAVEDKLGLAWERGLNAFVDSAPSVAAVSAVVYASLHFVVTPGTLVWLYMRHQNRYRFASTVIVLTTCLALIGFYLLPTAPPRMYSGEGFVDIMAKTGSWGWWPESGTPASDAISNQFAAMPSLHCAWAAFCGIAVVLYTGNHMARILGVLYPLLTFFVVMGTANHYLLDVVGGLVTLALAYCLAWLLRRAWRGYLARHLDGRIVDQLTTRGAA